jgi:GT2 family glycosyltransferase
MNENPLIYVIILAWNQFSDTRECLQSLLNTTYCNLKCILVDNGSTDETAERIEKEFPRVKIIRTETNLGISGGYNLGLQYALNKQAEYLVIMNNDTVIDSEALAHMLKAIQQSSSIGMVMPKIFLYNQRDRLWCIGARWRQVPPSVKTIGANAADTFFTPFSLEFAPSCCLMISRKALEEVGLFDLRYKFYYSDWDFSLRFRKRGYIIRFVPEARLWHKVSQSTVKENKPAKWWYNMGQGSVLFFLSYTSFPVLVLHSIWFMIRETIKFKFRRVTPFAFGVIDGISEVRGWKI